MNFTEILQQNWYIFLVMGIAVVVSIVYAIVRSRGMKSSNAGYLKQYPDAARVYLTSKALITSEAVTVYSVNGETPQQFAERGKTGFYVKPGLCTVEMSYSYTRPGVMYKNVTTSTDVVTKQLETQPHQNYMLGFNRKEEAFTFEDFAPA